MDLFEHALIREGGPLMWMLLLMSIIGFIFFVERTLYLHRGHLGVDAFLSGIRNLVRKARLTEALTVCQETPGPIANVVKAALLNFDQSPDRIRTAIQDAALVEIPLLERRIGTIGAIAKVSPLIGLLGTVVAMLEGFLLMGEASGYANASEFADMVAQALTTTAAGLAIAAIAHLAHHFLHGRLRTIVNELEWAANSMIQLLETQRFEANAADTRTRAASAGSTAAEPQPVPEARSNPEPNPVP